MNVASKIIFILLIGFIFSNGVQAQIYFPEDLLIDPLSSEIKELKVKKIEQFSFWQEDSNPYDLKYVVMYDSSFNLKTLLYNGQRRGDEYLYLNSENVKAPVENPTSLLDSFNIYTFKYKNHSKNYNFFRLDYTFEGNKFIKQEEIEAKYSSKLMNVGIEKDLGTRSTSFKRYYENNKIIKIEYFENSIIQYTEYFEYSKLIENSKIELLSKVIWKNGDRLIHETLFNYYF